MANTYTVLSLRPPLFTGVGFENWKHTMSLYLRGEMVFEVADGSEPRPELGPQPSKLQQAELMDWTRRDNKAIACIALCLAPNVRSMMKPHMTRSKTLMDALQATYGKRSEMDALRLEVALDELKYIEGDCLQDHLTKMEELFSQIAELDQQHALNENQKKLKLYKSLPKSWASTVEMLIATKKGESWSSVISTLLDLKTMTNLQHEGATTLEQACFVKHKQKPWRFQPRKQANQHQGANEKQPKHKINWKPSSSKLKGIRCWNCNGIGHMASQCPSEVEEEEANHAHIAEIVEGQELMEEVHFMEELALEDPMLIKDSG